MALAGQVIQLVGPDPVEQTPDGRHVVQIRVMKKELFAVDVRIGPQMLDPGAIEAARPPHESVHLAALFQKQIREVGSCLPGDARDEGFSGDRFFFHGELILPAGRTSP